MARGRLPASIVMSSRRWLLLLECVGLFYLLPLVLYLFRQHATSVVFPLLLVTAAACLRYLLKDETFERSLLGGWGRVRVFLVPILVLLLGGGLLLALYTWSELPELFLAFPKAEPLTWLVVLLLYPILAVVPQEIIFRCFFYQRYRALFSNRWVLIFFNGVSFGLYHVFYTHWQAVVLTLLGGWLFAYRYSSSRSLVIVCIEHALWGDLLFTIGLGWFLYTGSIQ